MSELLGLSHEQVGNLSISAHADVLATIDSRAATRVREYHRTLVFEASVLVPTAIILGRLCELIAERIIEMWALAVPDWTSVVVGVLSGIVVFWFAGEVSNRSIVRWFESVEVYLVACANRAKEEQVG